MRLEDLLPVGTAATTGALGGAAAGGTLIPGLGAIPGAAIGGAIGIGTGLYDAVRRDNAEQENAARLAAMEKELEKAGKANFELYMRDAAKNEGQQAQSLQQQAQEAGARGGLSQGQTFGLGLEAQTASANQASDAKGAAMLAATQATAQEKNDILQKYQVEQGLTNDALAGVGSASAALGGVAGGLMSLASLRKQLGNYGAQEQAPPAAQPVAAAARTEQTIEEKDALRDADLNTGIPANKVPSAPGLSLPGELPPGVQNSYSLSNPFGFAPPATPAPTQPAAVADPAAASIAPAAGTTAPVASTAGTAPLARPSAPAATVPASRLPVAATVKTPELNDPEFTMETVPDAKVSFDQSANESAPFEQAANESRQEFNQSANESAPFDQSANESEVDYDDLAEASHPEMFNQIAQADPGAGLELLESMMADAMAGTRKQNTYPTPPSPEVAPEVARQRMDTSLKDFASQKEASARQAEAIRQRTEAEQRGPLAPAYDKALDDQRDNQRTAAQQLVAELPVQLPSKYADAKSAVAAKAVAAKAEGDRFEAENNAAKRAAAIKDFDLKAKQQQLADIQAQAAALIEELKAYGTEQL